MCFVWNFNSGKVCRIDFEKKENFRNWSLLKLEALLSGQQTYSLYYAKPFSNKVVNFDILFPMNVDSVKIQWI